MFIKQLGISNEEKYRVFVPFNVQMPQVIVKSLNPTALDNKRFILRIGKWNKYSPFPYGQFVRILGEEGKMATESAMILHEFNVDTRPFS
jgi:exoribonuclease R